MTDDMALEGTGDGVAVQDVPIPEVGPADLVPGPRSASPTLPRVEPGSSRRRTHPCSEYWDVETARWTTRSPVPGPRQGD